MINGTQKRKWTLSRQKTITFWRFLEDEYDFRVKYVEPKDIKGILRLLKLCRFSSDVIDSLTSVVNGFSAITLSKGLVITRFPLGDETALAWHTQIGCAIHETKHVLQLNHDGPFKFRKNYLLSKARQAVYEAQAYGCKYELDWFMGKRPSPDRYIRLLDSRYLLGKKHREIAAVYFDRLQKNLSDWHYSDNPVQKSVNWLLGNDCVE
jgi:hypothetical protein